MSSPRLAPLLALLVSAGALGFALLLQFGFGLQPCPLCTMQRLPYALVILVAAMALITPQPPRIRGFLMLCIALCFLADGGVAFFHVGVEHHWWESACEGGGAKLANSPAALFASLAGGAHPVACDLVRWSLFGISLAGYNLIVTPVLAIASAWAGLRALKADGEA